MDIDALVHNFRESQKEREEEEEEENDNVLEGKKCRVKTHQGTVKSLKELQEFAVQRNDSDMLGVISQAKVFVESQAATRVNCVQKTCLTTGKNKEKARILIFSSVQCNVCVCSMIIL
jgi:hypothetical protein